MAFTGQIAGGEYIHDNPEEYAEFVLATYLHMRDKYGFVPDAWEILLEPDNVAQWNGITIGNAIVAAAKRLEDYGFTPRFIAPSNTNMGNAVKYFDDMISIPGVLPYIEEFSYHRYGGVSQQNLLNIANRASEHGINTSMLEWWFGNAKYNILHNDLTVGINSAWQGRTLKGMFNIDISGPGTPKVSYANDMRYNILYFRNVRKGALRIEAERNNGDFDPIAFINEDGKYTIISICSEAGSLEVNGLPEGVYGINYTTASVFDASIPDITVGEDGRLMTTVPDAGVFAIYCKELISNDVKEELIKSLITSARPNPFSGNTVISYQITKPGNVVLSVHDALGNKVRVLVDEYQSAGKHETILEANDLPAGVLYYKISIGEVTKSGKIILVK